MNDRELVTWFYNQKVVSETDCWEWTGVLNGGYGHLSVKGKRILAHRFSLQIALERQIPSNLEVRHMCNNSKCINPEHLKEGTHSDNMNDMVLSGRQARGKMLSDKLRGISHPKTSGAKNGRAKLTEEDVIEIRNSSNSQCTLAIQYGVNRGHIRSIQTYKSWTTVTKVALPPPSAQARALQPPPLAPQQVQGALRPPPPPVPQWAQARGPLASSPTQTTPE